MLAAAPMAKMAPSIAAATGTETGRLVDSGEVKRSMIRPRVNGTDKDTADDTASYNAGEEGHLAFSRIYMSIEEKTHQA